MKKLLFKITVPDKYTKVEYKAGEIYEFKDERADEILKARTKVTNEPYAVLYEEEVVQAVAEAIVEQAEEDEKTVEEIVNEIVEESKEEKPKKRTKKSAK